MKFNKTLCIMVLISTMLSFSTTGDFNYDKAWKEVEKALNEGLPKTALDKVEEIYVNAKKEDNIPQMVKATQSQVELTLNTEELGLESVVFMIENRIASSKTPTKELLHSISAELFQSYFQNQYYYISQRTQLDAYDTNDIRTWAPNNYRDYIEGHYLASTEKSTRTYDSKAFKVLLQNSENVEFDLRPTLYDLLVDKALSYFSSTNNLGISPSFAFEISDPSYIGSMASFESIDIATADIHSKSYQAIKLYQDVIKFNASKKNLKAVVSYDVERLNFVLSDNKIKDVDTLYLTTLRKSSASFDRPYRHTYQLEEIRYLMNKERYEDALAIVTKIEEDRPDDFTKKEINNTRASILQKEMYVQIEQVNPVAKSFDCNLYSRNVDHVLLKIKEANPEIIESLNRKRIDDVNKIIDGLKTAKEWKVSNDFNHYKGSNKAVVVEGLPKGSYILVANTEGKNVAYASFFVSDIGYATYNLVEGKTISVRNRLTGKPLDKAKIDVYNLVYDHKNRINVRQHIVQLETNSNGECKLPMSDRENFSYVISHKDDVLDLRSYDYNYWVQSNSSRHENFEIFTDRAIYRPGQIVHFKILGLTYNDHDVPAILPNRKISIELIDVNGQNVSSLDLVTNDFGSASGNFTIPVGRLTGSYTIRLGNSQKQFKVEEYKRPKFRAVLEDVKGEITLGDNISIEGIAESFSGAPLSSSKISYNITRITYEGWWSWYRMLPSQSIQIANGEGLTDEAGKFNINFFAKPDNNIENKDEVTYTYNIHVDVTDANGETRSADKSISISNRPYHYKWTLESIMDVSQMDSIILKALTTENVAVNTKAIVKISELVEPTKWQRSPLWNGQNYNYRGNNSYEGNPLSKYDVKKVIYEEQIDIGTSGVNLNLHKLLKAGAYKIDILSVEKFDGLPIVNTQYVSVTDHAKNDFPKTELLYIHQEEKIAQVGKEYEMQLGTCDPDLIVKYYILRGTTIIKNGYAKLDNNHTICYTPDALDKGGFAIFLDYMKHGVYKQQTININLPWSEKHLNIELITKRDKVLPGSKESWQLKISGKDKDKVAAEVLATMYDASLDQFVVHDYHFSPFPNHYSQLQNRIFGFDLGMQGNLNHTWNNSEFQYYERGQKPILQGQYLNYGYSFMGHATGVSVRGSRSKSKEAYVDGVRMENMSAPPMVMEADMEESKVVNDDAIDNNSNSTANSNQEVNIRTVLKESVFFYPDIKTDKDGNLILNFTMNEDLTTWKLMTLAHDKDLRYGMMSHEVKTQKELMIIPNAPRYFREGDVVYFPATISNLSDKSLNVEVELDLLDDDKIVNADFKMVENRKHITVNAGESINVNWALTVPFEHNQLIKYRVQAGSEAHTDGEENILPIITNRVLLTESKVISVRGGESKSFTVDALRNSQSVTSTPYHYTFEYTANPVWYAIQALPYIMEYPHQCSEQLFNRLYANTMAAHIANSSPKIKQVFDKWKLTDSDALLSQLEKNEALKYAILEESPWVQNAKSESEQKKRIALLFDLNNMASQKAKIIDQLTERQRPDGSFGWFPGGRANVYITQNIVEGIYHLKRLGMLGDEDYRLLEIADKAMTYIDEELKKRYEHLLESQKHHGLKLSDDHLDYLSIHYMYIRSFGYAPQMQKEDEEAYNYYYNQAKKYWLGKGLYAEAMIGHVLLRKGDTQFKDIANSMEERSFYNEDLGRYWNLGNGFNWHELPIEGHAMLISFFAESSKDKTFVDDMKVWLLKNKQTNHWATTKGTAAAIYALLSTGEEKKMTSWISDSKLPIISIGTMPLKVDNDNTEAGTGYIKKSWSADQITDDMSEIHIKNESSTIGWGAAYYQYFEDMDKVKVFRDTPLKIKRIYFIEKKTNEGPKLVEITSNLELNPGDRVISRIEIKVDRSMDFVHLKDMRPSGFEPENILSGYRWSHGLGYYESTRDVASHFFIDHLPKGTFVFEYPMRVVHKGSFSTGMATIQCMYAPEFTSHSDGTLIDVK